MFGKNRIGGTMRTEDLPAIRQLPLFADMDAKRFAELMRGAYFQMFPPQVELIREGDPADFLYVVVEGRVELFARSNGREATMALVEPASTFILAAVLKDAVYLMSARTNDKSRILLIPSEDVRQAFREDDAFARAIVVELASRYRSVVKDHKNHKLRTAVERLANYLLAAEQRQGNSGRVVLAYDKKTLASLLGMTAENLSRAFNTLKPYGVEVNGAEIGLGKLADLRRLAKPNALIDDETS
jgi:CRP/FNR family transcriptional regulator, transcriptional activator FtrB